ncbi:MAG: PleD family two-component system response regulator [Alphaproteobacteria bacterium]|nr:PleD family two-component system response regulator [Alphaproteobacteria bacterium]
MTALILVVDDRPTNVLLLETKLSNEYYDVVTARDGFEAIQKTKERNPDLILLDVMMPGIDGFEVCRRLKSDPEVAHIPVVMVTALSSKSDRLRGLEVGADDFLTKPFNDIVFFARTKSLIRIKMMLDELRLRDQTAAQIGGANLTQNMFTANVSGSRILVVDDNQAQSQMVVDKLSELYHVDLALDADFAQERVKSEEYDVIMISTEMSSSEGLRLASLLKSREETRNIPLIIMVNESRTQTMLKALELGINDYLLLPVDTNEMMARVKTQIRRKKYQDALRSSYEKTVSRSVTDALTNLYNRHFMDTHLDNLVHQANKHGRPLSIMLVDVDHFKPINDSYGHDVGDEVLQSLSKVVVKSIRTADMAARFGGEEFVVLLPETDLLSATVVTDRIRQMVEVTPFRVSHSIGSLNMTVSIGAAQLRKGETSAQLLKRADEALYKAKTNGRNQVQLAARV